MTMKKCKTNESIVWSKSNAGELFPFVATPMTFSVSKKFITPLLSPFTKNFGVDIAASFPFGLVAGRIYINMNFAAALIKKATFSMKNDFSEFFGGDIRNHENAAELLKNADGRGVKFSWLKFILRIPETIFHFAAKNLSARKYQINAELIETLEKYYAADFKKYPDSYLLSVIDHLSSLLEKTTEKAWPIVLATMIASSWVFSIFGSKRANILLSAIGGMDSADSGTSLLKLALSAKNLGFSKTLISFEKFDRAKLALETTNNGRMFLCNFEKFMRVHGHHAAGEVDAARPRWHETPDYILSIVNSYLARGDMKETLESLERLRAEKKAQTLKILSEYKLTPLKRVFSMIISAAGKGLTFRENYKNRLVMMIDITRKVLLEAASRLVGSQIITEQNDIFFIDLDELKTLLDIRSGHAETNSSNRKNIREANIKEVNIREANIKELNVKERNIRNINRKKINIRKIEYSNCEKIDPPSFIVGDFDMKAALENIEKCVSKEINPAAAASIDNIDRAPNGSVFKGIAVSAGVMTGPARVVKSAETIETVAQGEILVAPFTDPGWTPYFVNAAGLVTALGGPLSHGSIIAREYGIPAVVNVKNITALIKTGQRIKVDGYKGTVTVL